MSDQLTHYGVLGMKWGRRKDRRSSSSAPIRTSADHKTKVRLKKKRVSEMSNEELRQLNNRLQLERQYADLNKASVASGKKVVTDILTNAAKQTVTTYAAKYMSKALESAIKKAAK